MGERRGRWLILLVLAGGCGGAVPSTLGPRDGGLAPCPSTPNCVHTGDRHPEGTLPLPLAPRWLEGDSELLWDEVEGALRALPGAAMRQRRPGYLHAEVTSRIFRFVDDVEVVLDRGRGELVVRSASRVGRSDLGVNGRRVAALREALEGRGVLLQP